MAKRASKKPPAEGAAEIENNEEKIVLDILKSDNQSSSRNYDDLIQKLVDNAARSPAVESEADQTSRIQRSKAVNYFAFAILAIVSVFLLFSAVGVELPLFAKDGSIDGPTRQWAQTIIAGIVGGALAHIFGPSR